MLNTSDSKLFTSMKRFFLDPEPVFFCEECEEMSPIHCAVCGGSSIRVLAKTLQCKDCGHKFAGFNAQVGCSRGHITEINHPEAHLVLLPKSNLQQEVARYIRNNTDLVFNPDEEFFWIDSMELKYVQNSNRVIFVPEEVEEFRVLPQRSVIQDDLWEAASKLVLTTKEKCEVNNGHPRRRDCEECFAENPARICLPKFLRALSDEFMPLPHGGMEFGDASFPITVNGDSKIFIGIAKSAKPNKPISEQQITFSDSVAGEILRQTMQQAIRDKRVEIFGIVTPRPLHPEFAATLKMLAKLANKPLIFLGHEELTRMCCALILNPKHQALKQLLP